MLIVALLPMAMGGGRLLELLCTCGELVILAAILLLLHWARARHWHERWMEYRLLAELIRELRFLIPLGGGKPLPRIPAHLAIYGDPAQTWMYWHVRAIARQTGIPTARVTPAYASECLDFLARVVGDRDRGQWGFHALAERRSRLISTRLRDIVFFLFALTVAGVGLRLGLHFVSSGAWPVGDGGSLAAAGIGGPAGAGRGLGGDQQPGRIHPHRQTLRRHGQRV